VITRNGGLVERIFTGGEVHEVKVAPGLLDDIVGCTVIGDQGYDSNELRMELEGNNNRRYYPDEGQERRKSL
jgi:hypothetical protein